MTQWVLSLLWRQVVSPATKKLGRLCRVLWHLENTQHQQANLLVETAELGVGSWEMHRKDRELMGRVLDLIEKHEDRLRTIEGRLGMR